MDHLAVAISKLPRITRADPKRLIRFISLLKSSTSEINPNTTVEYVKGANFVAFSINRALLKNIYPA